MKRQPVGSMFRTSRRFGTYAALLAAAFLTAPRDSCLAQSLQQSFEFSVGSQRVTGTPMVSDGSALWVLRTDGRLTKIQRDRIDRTNPLEASTAPLSPQELRGQLALEFGEAYQVSVTRHFVVVHPPGDFQTWAQPFETLFARFQSYFENRKMGLNEPEFPLVAVVLNSREEFDRFLARNGKTQAQVVGYYSTLSNRIITYRDACRPATEGGTGQPSATLIHESAHQAAFNTGIHSRFAETPRWMSEGLATLFEARGVHHSQQYGQRSDRILSDHLAMLKSQIESGQLTGKLRALIEDDRLFESDARLAYALAWGISFYLAETRPNDYSALLRNAAEGRPFEPYPATRRLRDFQSVLGEAPESLEPHVWRFLASQ